MLFQLLFGVYSPRLLSSATFWDIFLRLFGTFLILQRPLWLLSSISILPIWQESLRDFGLSIWRFSMLDIPIFRPFWVWPPLRIESFRRSVCGIWGGRLGHRCWIWVLGIGDFLIFNLILVPFLRFWDFSRPISDNFLGTGPILPNFHLISRILHIPFHIFPLFLLLSGLVYFQRRDFQLFRFWKDFPEMVPSALLRGGPSVLTADPSGGSAQTEIFGVL